MISQIFDRTVHVALCGAVALVLVIGCPRPGRSQTSASGDPVAVKQNMMSVDLVSRIRNGTLFSATAPLSEKNLRYKDGMPTGVSFTVPFTIDRVNNRLFVQAKVNNRRVRLILDTAGGPVIALNAATAKNIGLAGKVPIQIFGGQGTEPGTFGLAKSLEIGGLTLQGIATTVGPNGPFYNCTLGLSVFERYRVALDFAANTMTLTRGGILVAPPGGTALSIPFDDDDGYIFVPVRTLGQAGWALLDSGSDMNSLSFKAAKAAASQIPALDAKTAAVDRKIGAGDTARKFQVIKLKSPVPISMDTTPGDAEFNTTSWLGMSSIDDVLDPGFDAHTGMIALLGMPFFLQFQRVIIDYPSHTLILQYPPHDTDAHLKIAGFATTRDKPWPGYKWLQRGYAWIEVADVKSASVSPARSTLSPQTTVTQKTTTTTTSTTISTSGDGSVEVTINGTKIACPPGSTVQMGADGVVHILPPGSSPVK